MRYLIKLSYDGSNYSGFQTQKGLITIQEQIEKALTKINDGKYTPLVATGRTDKGVHAIAQYAHVDIDVNITEHKLKRALNSNMPNDIHVIKATQVDNQFHARYNVKGKTYKYVINTGEYNPLERNYVFQYNYKLDIENIKEAIKYLEGKHDFRAFVTDNKEKENCIREIYDTKVEKENDKIIITFRGNGFMRYQVRNMVGILIRVGEGKMTPSEVKEILDSKDRTIFGKTAPAEGLYLVNVEFND